MLRPVKGVNTPHRKGTADLQTVDMPVPERVIIPMQQHIGAPCTPLVKAGDTVKVGQKIGDSGAYISAPVHSSVSGTVERIAKVQMPNGDRVDAVHIKTDGKQEVFEGIAPPSINSHDDLVKAVRESGLVGLGGAGFPAHVKLNPPKGAKIDTLIINAAECEPYITSDYRECIENSWDIMSGVYTVCELLGIDRAFITVEDNKPEAIKVLSQIADSKVDIGDHVKIKVLRSKYPQGAEKVLIHTVTSRRVPVGKLPSDVGVLVMNVTSIAFIARYLKTGMPLVDKRLTVDGAVKNPANVRVLLGTPVKDVFEFCGGFTEPPAKIIMGGPMMGITLYTDQMPVLKQNNALLAFGEKECFNLPESACIRCGKCIYVCPMSLAPCLVSAAVDAGDTQMLNKLNVESCIECGSCAFICPARKLLVQDMRQGKSMLKKSQVK
ncbi:MAG TPA: electron transport complex subunit RsxC [Clostridia bacterium]|nr:electron transport complex subunit RsxC [Clostridia bacterium]